MNRCLSVSRVHRTLACALLAAAAGFAAPPATAQVVPGTGSVRNFPTAALRGTLVVNSTVEATLNGKTIRMAPGMRLFSPQNSLVYLHTVIGQKFDVNYVLETSTGMLHAAWVLTKAEAAVPRKTSAVVPGDAVHVAALHY